MTEENEIKDIIAKEMQDAHLFASMQGIDLSNNVTNLVKEWILITYDLPNTVEGNKARFAFLKQAPKIGAVMHTRSVYLMPNTKESQLASLELTKHGDVEIWISEVEDVAKQTRLTEFYDKAMDNQLTLIEKRLNRIKSLQDEEKFGMATRMINKTSDLLNSSLFAITQRGSKTLYTKLTGLQTRLLELSRVGETVEKAENNAVQPTLPM
jgi:ribosomal protein L30/L7E